MVVVADPPIEKPDAAAARAEALIGRTRTAVLECIGDGRTTTELARRIGVSGSTSSTSTSAYAPSSASYSALRS